MRNGQPGGGKLMSDETDLSPAEQAIHMASAFYAELTMNAVRDDALVDIIEKLPLEVRRTNFVTACGLKSNFSAIGGFPLELKEYAQTAIDHLDDVVYCHAALVQILRAQELGHQFADEIELNNKVDKVLQGVSDELFAILSEEEGGEMIDEEAFAARLWGQLHAEV